MRRVATASLGFVLGFGFYLLLIDTATAPELYAAAVVAIVCALAFEVSREQGIAEARFRMGEVGRIWRALAEVPVQVALVTAEICAQLLSPRRTGRGRLRAVPFKAGTDRPRDTGRRALAEAAGSLAPNTIVIGIDPDTDLLLVHELRHRRGRAGLDPLELG